MFIYDSIYFNILFVLLLIFCILLLIFLISKLTFKKISDSSQDFYYKYFNKYGYTEYRRDKDKIEKEKEERLDEMRRNQEIENKHVQTNKNRDAEIVGVVKPTGRNQEQVFRERMNAMKTIGENIKNTGSVENTWENTVSTNQKTSKSKGGGSRGR